ncbi:hypothetical protein [Microbacterium sp. TNHR37B]|uniref:hypothetical protein n=1 Tax=Microbacterium sp. TNHR37B TaxID=1775956 RepID=UPI0007B2366F|nr:hypothetical protein [Microbacterium sp. TNHR37B]KZE91945.1 hypothetical protein AVP41_01495 [Microbacterium sp. TNHR37B]
MPLRAKPRADPRHEARLARDESARLAGEANAAFVRQAEAQEHANRLKEKELTPPDWAAAHVQGAPFRATNTSERPLVVESIDVQPSTIADRVTIETSHQDGRYAYGDSFDFLVVQGFGGGVEKISIRYRYESDDEVNWRTFHMTL